MEVKSILRKTVKTATFAVVAVVLLVCGTVAVLYSPWTQRTLLDAVLNRFGSMPDGTRIGLQSFSLDFPLRLRLSGLELIQNGDTLAAARSVDVRVNPLGLLAGRLSCGGIELSGILYRMGVPDSAMYMTIAADTLSLAPARVRLYDMGIELDDGMIGGGRVSMVMNPDTSAAEPPSEPGRMSISLGRIELRDFEYTMRYMPVIDTLRAQIDSAVLDGGLVDMHSRRIALESFGGSGLHARYISPDSSRIAAFGPVLQPAREDTVVSEPWTVTIDTIGFVDSEALYATAGVQPLPGLDFGHISVSDLTLGIRDFYNRSAIVRVPLDISGTERCGVTLRADGTLEIDSTALHLREFSLATAAGSEASFSGTLGMGDMLSDPGLPLALRLTSVFAPSDISDIFPAFAPVMAGIPDDSPLMLDAGMSGTVGHLGIDTLRLRVNHCVTLSAQGWAGNFMNPQAMEGSLELRGDIVNVNGLKNRLVSRETARQLSIPPMQLRGNASMQSGVASGRLTAVTAGGDIHMEALWNSRGEDYNVHATAVTFPVQAFMPLLEIEDVSARLDAEGHGYSPFRPETRLEAALTVGEATYRGDRYGDIGLTANLADGMAEIHFNSDNEAADISIDASGNLAGTTYCWTARLDGRNIDLHALGMMTEPCTVEMEATLDASATPEHARYIGRIVMDNLYFRRLSGTIALSDVEARLMADSLNTAIDVVNRDFSATFDSPCIVDTVLARFGGAAETAAAQIARMNIRPDSISAAMPPFSLKLNAGARNMVNDVLGMYGMSLRRLNMSLVNDSLLRMDMAAQRFQTESMTMDSLFVNGIQRDSVLLLSAGLDNSPGNMDQLHSVRLDGSLHGNTAALRARQHNLQGRTGFDLGFVLAAMPDTTFILNVKPYDPVIGYRQWTVNDSNYISFNLPAKHISANLRMRGGNSALALYTEAPAAPADSTMPRPAGDDLVLQLTDIHIQDWISFNPFAPPMKGDISANMRLNRLDGAIVGHGTAGIGNFTYGRKRVADMEAGFNVAADRKGRVFADARLLVDGVKTITLRGALNDSTAASPLNLDFSMIRFPLSVANPFLPAGTGQLSGMLNGSLAITGSTGSPVINGYFDFDSTAVKVAMLGSSFSFSGDSIPVCDSKVSFDSFAITGSNDKPLTINGSIDLSDFADARYDLRFDADGTQLVNSRRAARGADVYGKAFVGLDARVRGSMQFMDIDADIRVLPETNVTYVMSTTATELAGSTGGDMVKFVNFTDSMAVVKADSIQEKGMMMLVNATLAVEDGSVVNVDLDAGGSNKVQIESDGILTFSMTPMNTGRLTGRLNINKGFARYGMPPVLSEQLFNFERGSYVAFSGDMMNPTLNIHAVNVIKANVTQEGANSRLVNFDVGLGVTGTLERMNVAFDLSTNDDISVANELESMSPEQRANQAMNLMLYHVYTGPGTKASSSLGNPLYSFLAGQLNQWAASAVKGVDVSFGIDQYDRTVGGSTSQTMSYSYQVSKTLFNDRFKIVVGGNYSTDANADENFSQNLINDISFEYYLNRSRSMYLRLFRHTGYESILEGEITQTGVGFVYRRKLQRLGDMFLAPGRVQRRHERENRRLNDSEVQQSTDSRQ